MTLTIDLPPELDAALRADAEREGLDPDAYVLHLLRERFGPQESAAPEPLQDEAALLRKIQEQLPDEMSRRYHKLIDKRRAETLTAEEQAELIAMSDEIEAWTVRRLSLLIELSRLRHVPVPDLMQELGLTAPRNA